MIRLPPRSARFPYTTRFRSPPSAPVLLLTERRPHGVAGLVTPWNFPLAIPLWKAAPALAAGNAVLLKPAPDATATAVWLGALVADAPPDGLFHVLPGRSGERRVGKEWRSRWA